MHRTLASVAVLAGLLSAIGGTVAASAGSDITAPETILTVGTTVKEKFVDVGKKGPSAGDTLATTVDIKSQGGADLGTERTFCTLGNNLFAICTGAFDITGRGEIVGTGTVNFAAESPDFDVPITGGTGDFANVRGVAHVHLTKDGENSTLDLLP